MAQNRRRNEVSLASDALHEGYITIASCLGEN